MDAESAQLARLHATLRRAIFAAPAALLILTGCSSAAFSAASGPVVDQAQPVAGAIVRVIKGHAVGELRITEMTAPDAVDPPYPSCLTEHGPSQRVVNFDLNWAGVNFGERGPTPEVRITIAGPDGTPLVAVQPDGPERDCQTVRSFGLPSEGKGWQLVYGMTLRQSSDASLTGLSVTVDGHMKEIHLSPACRPGTSNGKSDSGAGCLWISPGVPWTSGTPYSISLIV